VRGCSLQSASHHNDFLSEDAYNLALVLNELDFLGEHDRINGYLQRFCDRFEDVKVSRRESRADVPARNRAVGGAFGDPSVRRYVEVSLSSRRAVSSQAGAVRLVAEVLIEASEHTQLIVTTHSDTLVEALSDRPESVWVCERDFDNGTQFKRLSHGELDAWLEHYTLGELWRKGEIGRGRW
jgi:SRSO17 transposase